MASTVTAAFNEFLKDTVNLDPADTKKARSSREWLLGQIQCFPSSSDTFPDLYSEMDIHFGSFARRTKTRPLDDIDQMICLHASGGCYYPYTDKIEITVPETATKLKALCNEGTNVLNSRKVINKFVAQLGTVPQYEKAEIKRNMEAATLKLVSYDWNFDIVPCFHTVVESLTNRTYYLIPDGHGNWKKTDPRRDRARVSEVNQAHDGHVLNVIRIIKYWNKRQTMPSMESYLLEAMILNYYFVNRSTKASQYVDLEIPNILNHIKSAVLGSVNDPKEIQGDINTLSWEDRLKIYTRADSDYQKAVEARNLETTDKQKESIQKWGEIFGSAFPKYTG